MSDAWENHLLRETGSGAFHRFDFLAPESEDPIPISRDKDRRLTHFCAVEKRSQGPVAIDVAIIIEAAGKYLLGAGRAENLLIEDLAGVLLLFPLARTKWTTGKKTARSAKPQRERDPAGTEQRSA